MRSALRTAVFWPRPPSLKERRRSFKGSHNRCTGKERDQETGLDYFGARYFGAALGRFTSPDDPLVDQHVSDPQSWNLYAYVRNNPLKNTDPFGLDCITTSDASSSSLTVTTERRGSADTCSGTHVNGTVNVNSYSYNGSNLSWSDNSEWRGGAMNFVFGSTASSNSDWGPGSGNMLGARQIGMTAPDWRGLRLCDGRNHAGGRRRYWVWRVGRGIRANGTFNSGCHTTASGLEPDASEHCR
jgi:RHS repeat-associated protein